MVWTQLSHSSAPRGRGGQWADETERTLVLPGCGWHRGRSLGLGPSTQAQVPRLFPGAAQMSFKEEKSGKLRLSETWATQ